MNTSPAELDARLYFGRLDVLVVESSKLEAEILSQVFMGFKVRGVTRLDDALAAQDHVQRNGADLTIVGTCQAGEGQPDAYDFIRWLRRHPSDTVREMSVILLAGHTLHSNVVRARDCGASFVIAKPITPQIMYERIVWLAKDARAFITCASYAGPDRRFQKLGPPAGQQGRRRDDLSLHVGEARAPNLSQHEIDAMVSGKGALR